MRIHFGQFYVRPGVKFPFSWRFQAALGKEISALVTASTHYIREYGVDFELIVRVSAKKAISDNDIKGPTVFAKDKHIEFTIFLPYDAIAKSGEVCRHALRYLFKGLYAVLETLEIDATAIRIREPTITDQICQDPTMFARM